MIKRRPTLQAIRFSHAVAGRFVLLLLLGAMAAEFNPAAAVEWGNEAQGFYDDPTRWVGGAVPTPSQSAVFSGPDVLVLWGDSTGDTTSSSMTIDETAVTLTGCCGAAGIPFTHTTTGNVNLSDGRLTLSNGPNEPMNLDVGNRLQLFGSSFSGTGLEIRHESVLTARELLLNGSQNEFLNISGGSSLEVDGSNRSVIEVRGSTSTAMKSLSLSDQSLASFADLAVGQTGGGSIVIDVLSGSAFVSDGRLNFGVSSGGHSAQTEVNVSGANSLLSSIGTGPIIVAKQATLNIGDGGTLSTGFGGLVVRPDGKVNINAGGTLDINGGTLSVEGQFIQQGAFNLNAGETVSLLGGGFNQPNALFEVESFDNSNGGTLNHTGGRLIVDGGAFNPGPGRYTISGGSGSGSPSLILMGNATSTLDADAVIASGSLVRVTNEHKLDVATLLLVGGGFLDILNGAEVEAAIVQIQNPFTEALAVVEGEGARLVARSTLEIGGINNRRGALIVLGEGRAVGNTSIVNRVNGTISGSGILESPMVRNDGGVIAPDGVETGGASSPGAEIGVLRVDGNFVQRVDGSLHIELAGPNFGNPGADTLAVTGTATLAGDLEVTGIHGFAPSVGERFDVLTASSLSGEFAPGDLPTLFGAIELAIVYTPTSVSLVVTPMLDGDFNADGTVDAADYTVWRDSLGSTTNLVADANLDSVVDEDDYQIWSQNFGATLASLATSVPEPTTAALLLAAVAAPFRRRR